MKLVSDDNNFNQKHLERLREMVEVKLFDDRPDLEQFKKKIQDVEILVPFWTKMTPEVISAAHNLRYVIVPSVGYEWTDVDFARKKGIDVVNCPTHNTYAVAEHTLALMLAVSRNIVRANQLMMAGKWKPFPLKGVELRNRKVVLVGHGNIGSKSEKLFTSLGMDVFSVDSRTSDSLIDEHLKTADYLVLNVPLTDKTRHMIDKRRLSLLKKTAYVINTARGAIIDESALFEFLSNERIAGAGLDVFEEEGGKPLAKQTLDLVNLPNVIATPHIGWHTQEAAFRKGEEIIQNVEAIVNGKPINLVN